MRLSPFFLAVLIGAGLLSACANLPERIAYTAADQSAAMPLSGDPVRFWSDSSAEFFLAWRQKVMDQRNRAGVRETPSLLAISGGSDKGAFSAGLLAGWSAGGNRPQFTMVTGVSTGALIAPFAFMGSMYDEELKELYTGINSSDIYESRGLAALFGAPSFLNTEPLSALIAKHITPELLSGIAQEHARGRRLLVLTTNLDAQRGVIWDMGAIASSASPDRLQLFRKVLLASASIPGAFTPVLIEAESNGKHFAEMHVDGSTTAGFLALPQSILGLEDGVPAVSGARILLLYNGRIEPRFELVPLNAMDIVRRALTTSLTEADRANIAAIRRFSQDNQIRFSLCAIGNDFAFPENELFDGAFMSRLYQHGFDMARTPNACATGAG